MKTRAISAVMLLILIIPLVILGDLPFDCFVFAISLVALKEFIDMKQTEKSLPMFIKFISYVFLTMLITFNINQQTLTFTIDYRIISGMFLSFLLPTILYHDKEKYSINDAFSIMGGVFFLSLTMMLLSNLRTQGLLIFIFLLLIPVITDTFAYLTGLLIGRYKLLPEISPKKTWEGTIGGTIFGVFVSTVFYNTVINPELSIIKLICITTFLSILGQFGDLFFSAIKRHYNKKDFSNLIPGHGGVLDRIDNIVFVLLGFMFFISVL